MSPARFTTLLLVILALTLAACGPATATTAPAQPAPSSAAALPGPASGATTVAAPLEATATLASAAPASSPAASQPPPAAPPASTPIHPTAAPAQVTALGPTLAFINHGDIWLLDSPYSQPYALSLAGDMLSFAWSPDGERLAAFNGQSLCFIQRDGSIRTACLELGLDETQALVARQMTWSPDQRYIVLWNPINPWDENAIGWIIVALDGSDNTWRIQDPVDWGASLAPNNEAGGVTGQALFLRDGRLVGTLSHRYLCAAGGCRYYLYELDLQKRAFLPFPNKPEEGWSEGQALSLSLDGGLLANFSTFSDGDSAYFSYLDLFGLGSGVRQVYAIEGEALDGLALSPDASVAVIARRSLQGSQDQTPWAQACGLTQGFQVYSMQTWDMAAGQRADLLPGVSPTWSPDGAWLAFGSCLEQDSAGAWQPSGNPPPAVFLYSLTTGETRRIESGSLPAWRP